MSNMLMKDLGWKSLSKRICHHVPYCSIENCSLYTLLLFEYNTIDLLSQYNLSGISITLQCTTL